MRRNHASLALLALAAAGCLPQRDNSHDPDNRPEAALQIIATAAGPTGCPAGVPDSFSVGHTFPRSWCIYLDARATSGAKSYRFVIDVPDAAPVELAADSANLIQVPAATLFALTVGEANTVTLYAKNAGGGVSIATQPLVLQNERPVAVAGPSTTLPVNGLPWAPGVNFTVSFTDGGSYDPDGDALSYCWRFEGPAEPVGVPEICSSDPADPQFTRPIYSTAGTTHGFLRVSDGASFSLPSRQDVFVGDPTLWASATGAGRPSLLDAERRTTRTSIGGTRSLYWAAPLPMTLGGRVAVLERRVVADETWVVLLDDRTTSVEGEILVGTALGNLSSIATDIANSRVWTIRDDYSNDQFLVDAFDVTESGPDAATLTPSLAGPVAAGYGPIEGADDVPMGLQIDDAGVLWLVPPFMDRVLRIQPDGTFDSLVFTGRRVGSASPRPGSTEAWVTDSPDFVGTGTGVSHLARYASATATTPDATWDLPGQYAHSQHWISPDQFWIADSTLGVLLVDAALLDAGFSFDESIVGRASDLLATIFMSVDTVTGDAFTMDVFGISTHRIAVDGSVQDLATGSFPLFLDRNGVLCQLDFSGNLFRSRFSDPTGIAKTLGVFSNTQPSVDPVTGGIWTYSQFPSSFQHIAPDGRVVRLIDRVDMGSGPTSIPQVRQIRTAFDGTWGVTRLYGPEQLGWIDLTETVPATVPVITTIPNPASGFVIAARPSSPSNSTRFIWELTSAGELYQAPLTGPLPAPVFTFPERAQGSNVMARMAPSMEDGSLCLLTVEDDSDPTTGPGTVRLRRISSAGAVSLLITTPQAPSTYLEVGTASTGSGPNAACWIVLSDTRVGFESTLLTGVLPNLSFLGIFQDPDRTVTSFAATTNDTIWMTLVDPADGSSRFVREDWNALAGMWDPTELAVLPDPIRLTAPNSMIVSGSLDEFIP